MTKCLQLEHLLLVAAARTDILVPSLLKVIGRLLLLLALQLLLLLLLLEL
jgi:hypothetical protein